MTTSLQQRSSARSFLGARPAALCRQKETRITSSSMTSLWGEREEERQDLSRLQLLRISLLMKAVFTLLSSRFTLLWHSSCLPTASPCSSHTSWLNEVECSWQQVCASASRLRAWRESRYCSTAFSVSSLLMRSTLPISCRRNCPFSHSSSQKRAPYEPSPSECREGWVAWMVSQMGLSSSCTTSLSSSPSKMEDRRWLELSSGSSRKLLVRLSSSTMLRKDWFMRVTSSVCWVGCRVSKRGWARSSFQSMRANWSTSTALRMKSQESSETVWVRKREWGSQWKLYLVRRSQSQSLTSMRQMMPSEQMSALSPERCWFLISGALVQLVPTLVIITASSSTFLASPKSMILHTPLPTMMFSSLRSRCTMRWRCSSATPRHTCWMTATATASSRVPPLRKRKSFSVSPLQYSSTRKWQCWLPKASRHLATWGLWHCCMSCASCSMYPTSFRQAWGGYFSLSALRMQTLSAKQLPSRSHLYTRAKPPAPSSAVRRQWARRGCWGSAWAMRAGRSGASRGSCMQIQ